jgi:CheY-like chemotaxis protein
MRSSTIGSKATSCSDRKKVLIVENDQSVIHFCSYLVLNADLKLYTAPDLGSAYTTLANAQIDLVITTLGGFPSFDGLDLVHHVRTSYPKTPVLVLTPHADVAGTVRAIRAGATDYLMKPISSDGFQQKLNEWRGANGAFSAWANSQTEGLPTQSTFRTNSEIFEEDGLRLRIEMDDPPRTEFSKHDAVVADAARTLEQIIGRDIEETALFANIDEEELLNSFFIRLSASRGYPVQNLATVVCSSLFARRRVRRLQIAPDNSAEK